MVPLQSLSFLCKKGTPSQLSGYLGAECWEATCQKEEAGSLVEFEFELSQQLFLPLSWGPAEAFASARNSDFEYTDMSLRLAPWASLLKNSSGYK